MAVFRINKTKSYTVMSNYHLRDKTLSCKACGLLSKMLSLPEDWDYTTRGLASICKDGLDSICSALKELEAHGYLERRRLRDSKGMLKDVEYLIFEQPHPKPEPPAQDNPDTEEPEQENPRPGNPDLDEPDMENPRQEKPAQLNTKKQNTKKPKTNQSNTDSFLPSAPSAEPAGETDEKTEGQTDGTAVRERIKRQIEYDVMVQRTSQAQMDELGYKNVFVGTVEGIPEDTALPAVKKAVEDAGYTKVILRPMMVVAGDHANNDMASDEEGSWYYGFVNGGQFEVEGAEEPVDIGAGLGADNVTCQIEGLGRIADIEKMYVEHTGAVIK